MPLPEFNLSAKGMSSDKQMAMMRTYLSQLKDETETQLFDIKWDNLSSSLRKRLEDLDTNINQVSEYTQMTAQSIKANVIDANYIRADQVSTLKLDASQIKTGYLAAARIEAGSITASKLDTAYIATSWIDADEGFISKFHSCKIEAGQVSAGVISADKITSGTIKAARIDSAIMRTEDFTAATIAGKFPNASNGLTITTERIRAQYFEYYTDLTGSGPGYHALKLHTFTVNGKTYKCLGV